MEMAIVSYMKFKFRRIKEFKYLALVIFLAGFAWDSLTLSRVDSLLDNILLLAYLVSLGLLIVLVNLIEHGKIENSFIAKKLKLFAGVVQFLSGGLLSSYVVFYFQSASMTRGSIFLGVLVILFIGNEFLGEKASSLTTQLCLYFFVTFSYLIFAIPIVTKYMNYYTFLGAGIMSFFIIWGMSRFLYKQGIFVKNRDYYKILTVVGTLLVTINVFYLMNWIPPIPLSMKYSGIYHDVSNKNGKFYLTFIKPSFFKFWKKSDSPYLYREGDKVYCFTSIFAPTALRKKIYHHWLYLDPITGDYIAKERLGFNINGGRDGGFRGYTYKQSITSGKWRVEVRTEEGAMLGSVTFNIEPDTNEIRETKTIEKL
jgi:hypothetical protein